VVGQGGLLGHDDLYLIIHMLVLLLVFDFFKTVVRKPHLQRALGLVRNAKWQKHKAITF
jgi:hypothetical protein